MAGHAAAGAPPLIRYALSGALALAGMLAASASPKAEPLVVRIETPLGVIRAELEPLAAPRTTCNFLHYMDDGHFDGGAFYRTVRSARPLYNPVTIDVIQMQAREGPDYEGYGPIPLERTSQTGLTHRAGALSMARNGPDTGTSSWSIVVQDSPEMDFAGRRNRDGQGFAVFGYVIEGMAVVRAIQAAPANGEQLRPPIAITRIVPEGRGQAFREARRRCNLPLDPRHTPHQESKP